MRRIAIMFAASAALMSAAMAPWQAEAQIERGPAALAGEAQNFTPVPIEKAECGPHWGRWCGPWHHRVCNRWGRCWCAPC